MATTSYFEEHLASPDDAGKPKLDESKSTLEILVSSYSGTHRLYLKVIDPEGTANSLILDKDNAVKLLEGLERAAFYLRYIE